MNDRDLIKAVADEHANRDWMDGRRWLCRCDACEQARADGYEPKSTVHAMAPVRT